MYQNIFDQYIAEFVSSELLERQIEEEFSHKIPSLDPQDEYYEATKNSLEFQRKKELDPIFSMKMSRQKKHEKHSIKDIDKKIKEEEKNPKTKSIIEFNQSLACSIKSLAVKKPTTRFFSGKMLMFTKILLEGFTYDLTEIFFFPGKKQKKFLMGT